MREKQQFIKFTLFFATVYYRFQCSECHLVNVSGAVVFRFEKLNNNWSRFGKKGKRNSRPGGKLVTSSTTISTWSNNSLAASKVLVTWWQIQ